MSDSIRSTTAAHVKATVVRAASHTDDRQTHATALPDLRPTTARLAQLEAISQRERSEEEELLQQVAQRVADEEEPAQRIETPAPPVNRTGLPDALKSGVEQLSGLSLDHVRVHYDSSRPSQLSAHAYAQGSEIHVAPGQEQHLPHEAWHVVQQAQGRVAATDVIEGGTAINDDPVLEAEADVMGRRAAQS